MHIRLIKFVLILLVVNSYDLSIFAQDKYTTDSLENELMKYEAHKKELKIISPSMMDTTKANILYDLSFGYLHNDLNKSEADAKECLAVSQEIGYQHGINYAYSALGSVYGEKGDFPMALEYYQKSLEFNIKIGNKRGIGASYTNIGNTYDDMGNFPKSLENHFKALKVFEEEGRKKGIAYAYNNIALIYKEENNYEDALKYHRASLKIKEEINDNYGIPSSYLNIGNVLLHQDKFDEALENYKTALKKFQDLPDIEGEEGCYDAMGNLFVLMKNYPEAIKNYQESMKICEQLGNQFSMANTYNNLGETYYQQGNYQEALKNASKGLELTKKIGAKDLMKNSYEILANINSGIHNYKAAFDNEVLFKDAYDSVYNKENDRKLTQMQLQYAFEKQTDSIKAEQVKKDALAKKEIENQLRTRNLIFIGMGMVVVFLIITLIQRNKIAKEKRQKALEQERNRISKDLHDDLGSGLVGIMMMSEQIQDASNTAMVGNNIEKIKISSRQMVSQMGEIVWAMNSKNDSLENLLVYNKTYCHNYADDMGMNLKVELPESIPSFEMAGMMRRNIFLVVKESLNNIYKHAKASEVILKVNITNDLMTILLSDNGEGFEMNDVRRFGNGLKNMESRMKDIKGTYNIESAKGKGTKTILTFSLV
jgi:two-component system sensor histidine kinase UhpB